MVFFQRYKRTCLALLATFVFAVPVIAVPFVGPGFTYTDPSGGGTDSGTLAVGASGTVGSFDSLVIDIGDSIIWRSEMSVDLIAPDLTTVRVYNQEGAGGDLWNGPGMYTFTTAMGAVPITPAGDFNPGTYIPSAGSFAAFSGVNLTGNWTLALNHEGPFDDGDLTIDSWTMNISPAAAVPELDANSAAVPILVLILFLCVLETRRQRPLLVPQD